MKKLTNKKILIIILLFLISAKILNARKIFIGTLLPKEKKFQDIIAGIKKHSHRVKITDLLANKQKVDVILTNATHFKEAIIFNKPIFLFLNSLTEKEKYNSPLIKQIVLLYPSVNYMIKSSLKILKNKKLAVVVHDKKLYKKLKKLKTKNLRVYYVKEAGEVPYKINVALKKADALIAIPDNVVFNYFSMQFIFEKAILMGKYIIGYSENMLDLGAYAVISPNYLKEGCDICKSILNILNKKNIKSKILYPTDFKIIKNANFCSKVSFIGIFHNEIKN